MTPFDWVDFLTLAERLATDPGDEAAQRTAISRAYYAAYHAAAACVRAKGILMVGHTHRSVWRALKADPDPNRADAGRKGDRLRWFRTAADYRNPFPGDLGRLATTAVAEARVVIDDLDRLS